MKVFIQIILLLIVHRVAISQVPVTTRPIDTIGVPTDELRVMTDSVSYADTSILQTPLGADTVVKKKVHSPRGATLRSAIIPGWGQIYNGKIWKVPIVYAGIGFPLYLFVDNKNWYNRTRYALSVVTFDRYTPDSLAAVHPQLRALVDLKAEGSLINYRNEFRRNMDYSILFTLVMWGLNVVDATVDGHLKGFDVGNDLSLHIQAPSIEGAPPGLSLALRFK